MDGLQPLHRIVNWARTRFRRRRWRQPTDLVVLHGIHWVATGSRPLRQPVCPVCGPRRGRDAFLRAEDPTTPDTSAPVDTVVFRCPLCGWCQELTRAQEREGRGGAARHAIARGVGTRSR